MTSHELLIALAIGLLLALAWAALFAPVHLALRLEAGLRVPTDAALALGWGPIGISFIREPDGRPPRVELFVLGRRLLGFSLPERTKKKTAEEERERSEGGGALSLLAALEWTDRHLGLAEVLGFLASERRRIVTDDLSGALRYGFEDYEKTGLLHGYLWSIRGALGPAFRLQDVPDWSGRNVFGVRAKARLRLFPILLSVDLGLFLFSHFRIAGRSPITGLRQVAEGVVRGSPRP